MCLERKEKEKSLKEKIHKSKEKRETQRHKSPWNKRCNEKQDFQIH